MPLQRTQAVSALEHVVRVVFNQSADSPVSKTLIYVGFETIHDLLGLDHADIDDLNYVDENGTERMLSLGHRVLLRAFSAFVIYRELNNAPIGENWLGITRDDFDEFHASTAYLALHDFFTPTDARTHDTRTRRERDTQKTRDKSLVRPTTRVTDGESHLSSSSTTSSLSAAVPSTARPTSAQSSQFDPTGTVTLHQTAVVTNHDTDASADVDAVAAPVCKKTDTVGMSPQHKHRQRHLCHDW